MSEHKGLVKTVKRILLGHIRGAVNDIKTHSKLISKDEYGVDLNILEPKVKSIVQDIKDWNVKRKKDDRLTKDELKEVGKSAFQEVKSAVTDPEGTVDDEFSFLLDLGDDEDMDFSLETEEVEMNSEVTIPDEIDLLYLTECVTYDLLCGIDYPPFKNFLLSNHDEMQKYFSKLKLAPLVKEEVYKEELKPEVNQEDVESIMGLETNITINATICDTNTIEANRQKLNDIQEVFNRVVDEYIKCSEFTNMYDRGFMILVDVVEWFSNHEKMSDHKITEYYGIDLLLRNKVISHISEAFGCGVTRALVIYYVFRLMYDDKSEELLDTLNDITTNVANEAKIIL